MSWITLLNDHPTEMGEFMSYLDTQEKSAIETMINIDSFGPVMATAQAKCQFIRQFRVNISNALAQPPV